MRRAIVFCFGLLAVGALSAVLAKPKAQPAPGEDAAVLAADTALADAMRAGDKSAARRLLSLEFTYTDENGKLHERKDFLVDLKNIAPEPAADVKVRIYGLVAVVTGQRKSAHGSDAFFIDVWVRQKRAWRTLLMQDVLLASADARQSGAETFDDLQSRRKVAKFPDCKNPCETIPYRVRSPAEQDIINTYQSAEKAIFARDAEGYARSFTDDFVLYESNFAPVPKSERIAYFEEEKRRNGPVVIPAIQSMRLWVYGEGAAMVSTNGPPDASEAFVRVVRVWTKRNGKWQMVISVQTDVAETEAK